MSDTIPKGDDWGSESVIRSEHIGFPGTGENIQAKRVAPYSFNGTTWQRAASTFLDLAYDYVGMSNPDGNGNYQTVVYKTGGSGGNTVRTLSLTYDINNNVTSIARA